MAQDVIPTFTMMMEDSTKWKSQEISFIQEASYRVKVTTKHFPKRNSHRFTVSQFNTIKMDQAEIHMLSKEMVDLQLIKRRNKNIEWHSKILSENGTRYHFISNKEAEDKSLAKVKLITYSNKMLLVPVTSALWRGPLIFHPREVINRPLLLEIKQTEQHWALLSTLSKCSTRCVNPGTAPWRLRKLFLQTKD